MTKVMADFSLRSKAYAISTFEKSGVDEISFEKADNGNTNLEKARVGEINFMKSTAEEKTFGVSKAAEEIHCSKPTTDEITLRYSKGEEIDVEKSMTDDLAGITFRTTTAEDYDDVISVRRHLYDGTDKIPYRYYELLEHSMGFAGFINSIMVCFMFAAIIDDGKSVLIQAIRVRKEYEGKGAYSRLRAFCMKNLPNTANKSVIVINSPTSYEQLFKGSAKLVFTRRAMIFETTKKNLRLMLGLRDTRSLQRVDASYLEQLLRNRSATHYIFPENRVLINWIPYQLVSSNIEWMLRDTELLSTYVPEPDIYSERSSSMVSAFTLDQCEAGTVITFDLFGDICNEEVITNHVHTHLQGALDKFDEELVLYISFQEYQDTNTLLHVLSKYGWRKVKDDVMYGVEKPI